jgi:DNA topoisomerase-6 subunit B
MSRKKKTAKEMAKGQKSISISEFFAKNRHLLGFDNATRALMTTVKEAVDNALDACEEGGILPVVEVRIRPGKTNDRVIVEVTDNGPGIVKEQVGRIFGELLYGSKFHRLKQSRGQQGIGISAAGMYGMMTTGQPLRVTTCTKKSGRPDGSTGTRVSMEIVGRLIGGKNSIYEYLRQTSVANPHAALRYKEPNKDWVEFDRSTDVMPRDPREIKPHPDGIDIGVLGEMLKESKARTISSFFQKEFSRISGGMSRKTYSGAGLPAKTKPKDVTREQTEALVASMRSIKYLAPPTDCLSPIGDDYIRATLEARFEGEFTCATSRSPATYRGNPFQVEVGLAYGCVGGPDEDLAGDGQSPARIIRLANRVPLLYQQGACAITQSISGVSWKSYGMTQPRGGLPTGDLVVLVHLASVWVPFTSESKEAIASYDEIVKEIKLALQLAGRKLATFLGRKKRARDERKKKEIFRMYIGEVAACCAELNGTDESELRTKLMAIAEEKTGKTNE